MKQTNRHNQSASTRARTVLLSLSAGALLAAGCSKGHQPKPASAPELPTIPVQTQLVQSQKVPAIEEVVGTVRATLRATIEAKANGRIVEMPVSLGQKVKAGQILARLDAPEVKARLEQAEASLQQTDRDWQRASNLFKQQALTRAELETAESRMLLAKGAVAEARAMLSYIEVQAPFDGVITSKKADVGDLALPGKPLLEMEDPAKLRIEADVPEGIAERIQQDGRMSVRAGNTELQGTVIEIAPVADPESRTFRVKLDVQTAPGLRSGQFARIAVPVGETTALVVPASAVVQRGQMEIVFAVQDQRARLHLVKTGRSAAGQTEILSGLDSGDTVVATNATQLLDGQPIQVK